MEKEQTFEIPKSLCQGNMFTINEVHIWDFEPTNYKGHWKRTTAPWNTTYYNCYNKIFIKMVRSFNVTTDPQKIIFI